MKEALTYDDIQLVPKFSNISSRSDIKLHTLLSRRYGLLRPFVASPMDTICEIEMAYKLFLMGGVGCIHRFMSIEEQSEQIHMLYYKIYGEGFGGPYEDWGIMFDDWHSEIKSIPIMAAIGVHDEDKKRAESLVKHNANVLLIDVAHGHHSNVFSMISWCKQNLPSEIDIIAGNIVTAKAALDLQYAGADGLRVGVGGGCFTPNMEVKTINGLKKIKDIEIGDIVYTHTGSEQTVINKMVYNKDEEIMIINGIECTKNHEFYVINKKFMKMIINDDDIHQYAEWVSSENLTTDYFLIQL